MRTLTHVPLAMAGVLILGLLVACALIVWVAVAIRTRLGRTARPAEAGTESVASALGATGPGAASMRRVAPGPALAVAPGDALQRDFRAWLDAKKPAVWPQPPVIPGREQS